jgi:hypothetical protein
MMARVLLLFLLAVGLAFGGVESPSMAHAALPESAAIAVTDAGVQAEAAHRDHAPDDKNSPCHAMVHHHCSVGLDAGAPVIAESLSLARVALRPRDSAILSSLAQAPPLQPPSA